MAYAILSQGGMPIFAPVLSPTLRSREGDDGSGDTASYWNLRIASVFIILVGSLFGAFLPIILARRMFFHVPKHAFFVMKYFGSGVIIGTAWMHLMAPAEDALRDPILEPRLQGYDFAMAISLITVMVMFFIELSAARFQSLVRARHHHHHGGEGEGEEEEESVEWQQPGEDRSDLHHHHHNHDHNHDHNHNHQVYERDNHNESNCQRELGHQGGGTEHLSHDINHLESGCYPNLAAQMLAISILEFGVVFHSVFIGLTLAVAENFLVLFIVIIFHQLFEGLGLGSRLAMLSWPRSRWWVPWLFAVLYGVSTPLAIAAGLGLKENLHQGSEVSLLVNGIFDAISGGILLYTGLVELLAHEFMFSEEMRATSFGMQMFAFLSICAGAGIMAGLAKWG